MALGGRGAWAGWIAFASTIMIMTSLINIFQGMVALLDDERVVVTDDAFVIVDMTSWGWTILLYGVLMLAVGGCLLAGMTWARVVAIIVVGVHAVSQVAWLGAYPIYALLMIALDTVVLFALTARWSEARGDLRNRDDLGAVSGDPLQGRSPHEAAVPYAPRIN